MLVAVAAVVRRSTNAQIRTEKSPASQMSHQSPEARVRKHMRRESGNTYHKPVTKNQEKRGANGTSSRQSCTKFMV